MRFLIVDDEKFMQADLHDALQRVCPGCECFFASNFDEAVGIFESGKFDAVFLDVEMPGKNGLSLAQKMKEIDEYTNIIIVTAYAQYALDALKLFVSGYVLKPVMDEDLKNALNNLRYPHLRSKSTGKLEVRCFGKFEVFLGGVPVSFERKKAKELFAYLVALRGVDCGRHEICDVIFEDAEDSEKAISYFRILMHALRKDLKKIGFEDAVRHTYNSYSVNPRLIECDFWNYLEAHSGQGVKHEEFMSQYSWAERYIWELNEFLE